MDIFDEVGKYIKEETNLSLNYGELPAKDKFDAIFDKELATDGSESYNYNLKGEDADTAERVGVPSRGDFSADELYEILQKLSEDSSDDEAMDLAGSILYTLHIEWI